MHAPRRRARRNENVTDAIRRKTHTHTHTHAQTHTPDSTEQCSAAAPRKYARNQQTRTRNRPVAVTVAVCGWGQKRPLRLGPKSITATGDQGNTDSCDATSKTPAWTSFDFPERFVRAHQIRAKFQLLFTTEKPRKHRSLRAASDESFQFLRLCPQSRSLSSSWFRAVQRPTCCGARHALHILARHIICGARTTVTRIKRKPEREREREREKRVSE